MKILHTSDWHIGKRLLNRERLDEQSEVLDEMIEICDREGVELVLVAGDVFDTYLPSAEAEELFYAKVKKLAGEDRAVLIISGNHDDGVRLSAGSPLAEEQGIYIVGNERRAIPLKTGRSVRPIGSGKGWAIFQNGAGEQVYVNMLPYPNEARFKEKKSDLSFVEQMKYWLDEGEAGKAAHGEKIPSVLISHIFVLGGMTSSGEREIDLGGARALPVGSLPPCDYVALGHLHKPQHMGKGHCYYCGSPLAYSFDEANTEKRVKIFDLNTEGVVDLKDVPLKKGRRLVRLEADSVQKAQELLALYPDALAELKLCLTSPLTTAESAQLSENENLVSLITEVGATEELGFTSRKGFTGEKLFEEFYRLQYNGEEPPKELKEMFLSVLSESE